MANKTSNLSLRLLALLALTLLLVIGWVGIELAVTNPGLVLVYAAGVGVLLAGGWLAFSAAGRKRKMGVIVAGLGLLALVVATVELARMPGWSVLLLLALGAAYTATAAKVAQKYWARERSRVVGPAKTFRKPVLIVNPKSGDGRAIKAGIPEKAAAMGVTVTVTKKGDDIVALARAAAKDGADVIGVSGGDGTLGAVASVAMEHGLPLVVLPGGTRCHFARDIGLSPEHIVESLDGFTGSERVIDVGTINGRVFLNNASFGLYADIISREEYRDNKLEVSRTVTRELVSSEKPYYPLAFSDASGREHTQAAVVQVGVNRYETMKLGELGERKRLDGGELQVIVVPALNDQTLRALAGSIALPGRNIADAGSGLEQWTAKRFKISDPSGKVKVGVDGEALEYDSPVEIKIQPQALRLLVPAAGPSTRPIKPFSVEAAKAFWAIISGKV